MKRAFTLAEGATHVGAAANSKKCGFTLAEVLITLSIIGVVAALTIPELVKNMNDYALGKSRDITLAKITEATNQMKSNDVLSGYATNDAFVDEFQKYMKVTKRCDSATLVNCFPAKFKTGTGKGIDTTTLTAGTKLGDNNIAGNTIALMLANGTSILFTLRDSTKVAGACDRIDPTDNQLNTTGCLSFLYDINGYGSPNVMGKDIGSVNATISTCDGYTIGSLCVAPEDEGISNIAPSQAVFDDIVSRYGFVPQTTVGLANSRWIGAIAACEAKGMKLPTKAQLNAMYQDACEVPAGTACANPTRRAALGFSGTVYYWTSEEFNATLAWYQYFADGNQNGASKGTAHTFRCVK